MTAMNTARYPRRAILLALGVDLSEVDTSDPEPSNEIEIRLGDFGFPIRNFSVRRSMIETTSFGDAHDVSIPGRAEYEIECLVEHDHARLPSPGDIVTLDQECHGVRVTARIFVYDIFVSAGVDSLMTIRIYGNDAGERLTVTRVSGPNSGEPVPFRGIAVGRSRL